MIHSICLLVSFFCVTNCRTSSYIVHMRFSSICSASDYVPVRRRHTRMFHQTRFRVLYRSKRRPIQNVINVIPVLYKRLKALLLPPFSLTACARAEHNLLSWLPAIHVPYLLDENVGVSQNPEASQSFVHLIQ